MGYFDDHLNCSHLDFRIDSFKLSTSPECERLVTLDINSWIIGDKFEIMFGFNRHEYKRATIQNLVDKYKKHLLKIIEYCINKDEGEVTPSDFGDQELTIEDLDKIVERVNNL